MLSPKIKSALNIICNALPVSEINWAVAGRASQLSGCLAADGVAVRSGRAERGFVAQAGRLPRPCRGKSDADERG